jgi:hypothetical protein
MNVTIFGCNSTPITIGCDCAYISNSENCMAMYFENDDIARQTEDIIKRSNIKTKHTDSEITILNISDYNYKIN